MKLSKGEHALCHSFLFFCTILIRFLSYGKKMFIAFCIPEGLKNRWAFYVSCDTFLPAIHQTKSRLSPDTRALHPLPCLKICMRWNSLAIYNSTWWQEELNWRIMRVFFSIIAVKFFSCSRFLVLNSLVHTPTPPSGPQPTVLLSLPRMEHDTSAFLFTFMLACGMLCCWFSPTATDTLSTCSLEHPHGSSSHAWTLKISMS